VEPAVVAPQPVAAPAHPAKKPPPAPRAKTPSTVKREHDSSKDPAGLYDVDRSD
jgi:hypothetical protein